LIDGDALLIGGLKRRFGQTNCLDRAQVLVKYCESVKKAGPGDFEKRHSLQRLANDIYFLGKRIPGNEIPALQTSAKEI